MLCAKCTRRAAACSARRPELVVRDFLARDGGFPPAVHDKSDPLSKHACCRRRVDLRMDYTYFQVLVEVDEQQHARYGEACELVRLLDIVSASGGIATLLFRFNPDPFVAGGQRLDPPMAERLALLKERITRRAQQVLRRVAADATKGGKSLMPLLYVEYLFYSSPDARQAVRIRSYHDDACLARAAAACR